MKKSCFVCTTPYQIVAAVAIAMSLDHISDIYIIPQFNNAVDYKNRIEKADIFDQVIIPNLTRIERYKKQKNRFLFNLGIVRNYLNISRIVHEIIGDNEYSQLFISSQANIGRLMALYFLKQKKSVTKVNYFDDGEGSYDNEKISHAHGTDAIVRKVIFGKRSLQLSDTFYLYSPDLFRTINGDKYHLVKIPNWSEIKEYLNVINAITGFEDKNRIEDKYVLIDTISRETFHEEGSRIYKEIVDKTCAALGDRMIIKRHPRDNRQFDDQNKYYMYSSMPFEVICANSDIDDKVLITASSTSVLMPKLLFDKEPCVILLHKITGVKTGNPEKREKLIQSICSLYRDKNRIMIPETKEEYYQILENLNS